MTSTVTLQDVWRLIKHNALVLLAAVFIGGLLASLYSMTLPRLYAATSTGYVVASGTMTMGDAATGTSPAVQKANSYIPIVQSRGTVERIAKELQLAESGSSIGASLSAYVVPNSLLLKITAVSTSPERARAVADAAVRATSAEAARLDTLTLDGTSSGNSGIGLETMRVLAANGAHVIGTARDEARGRAACGSVRGRATPVVLELTEPESIVACARQVATLAPRIDALVCNAGIVLDTHEQLGALEKQFAVNHLGHFLLVNRLLAPVLAARGRVVVVGSGNHRDAPDGGIQFDDLSGAGWYRRGYSHSKLANGLFSFELARRLAGTGATSRNRRSASSGSTGIPAAVAKSFAVPSGRIASAGRSGASRPLPASALTIAPRVPSPPPPTRVSTPSSIASATKRATSPCSHVTRTSSRSPSARIASTASRTTGSPAALPLRMSRQCIGSPGIACIAKA